MYRALRVCLEGVLGEAIVEIEYKHGSHVNRAWLTQISVQLMFSTFVANEFSIYSAPSREMRESNQ